jgi:hypothetical protein
MMPRRLEVLPENLRGHFDPLAFPFVTTKNPPDDDHQAQRPALEEALSRAWNTFTRKRWPQAKAI